MRKILPEKLDPKCVSLEPQTTIYKWMFGETTIFYIKIWKHPIETTGSRETHFGYQFGFFQKWFPKDWFPWTFTSWQSHHVRLRLLQQKHHFLGGGGPKENNVWRFFATSNVFNQLLGGICFRMLKLHLP